MVVMDMVTEVNETLVYTTKINEVVEATTEVNETMEVDVKW